MNKASTDDLFNQNRRLELDLLRILRKWEKLADKYRSLLSQGKDFFDPFHEGEWNFFSSDSLPEREEISKLFSEYHRLFEERRLVLAELTTRGVQHNANAIWEALIKKLEIISSNTIQ